MNEEPSAVVKRCVFFSLLQFWLGLVHSLVTVIIILIPRVVSYLPAYHGKFVLTGLQALKNTQWHAFNSCLPSFIAASKEVVQPSFIKQPWKTWK